jgi:histidinol-phosphate aminotransferase
MSLTVRPGILDIAAYVPGEHDLPGSGPIYKMSSNESALGASRLAMDAYAKGAAELHRYPDGGSHALRKALAQEVGGKAEEIICGTGSDDILVLITRAYAGPGDEVLYSAPRLPHLSDRHPRNRWGRLPRRRTGKAICAPMSMRCSPR